jgi:large subunit ribosomal protein L22
MVVKKLQKHQRQNKMIKVINKFVHSAPRKTRLVLDAIVGLNPVAAISKLTFLPNSVSVDVLKTVKSAIASAKDKNFDDSSLIITRAFCDEGPKLKRRIVSSRGRARPIVKKMSHITIVLSETKSKPTKSNPEVKGA